MEQRLEMLTSAEPLMVSDAERVSGLLHKARRLVADLGDLRGVTRALTLLGSAQMVCWQYAEAPQTYLQARDAGGGPEARREWPGHDRPRHGPLWRGGGTPPGQPADRAGDGHARPQLPHGHGGRGRRDRTAGRADPRGALGCDGMQGYVLARPLSTEAARALVFTTLPISA